MYFYLLDLDSESLVEFLRQGLSESTWIYSGLVLYYLLIVFLYMLSLQL
uniref:Uncharacterized protein n=1 Tax=Rhizophora mucronata TaxID=61149 RepID=A0A2P2IN35_RHIMU